MLLLSTLLLICFLNGALGQNSCTFQSSRYNLTWSLNDNNDVLYNLTYFNFPTDGSYWVAFGYSQPVNNLILLNSINAQVEIGTANIVNNQPHKTVNSNILQNKSAYLSGGSLHAHFSIPLAALRLSSDNGDGCLQWQFFSNATKNGTDYNGMPQTQSICNIDDCRQRQLLLNDENYAGSTQNPYQYYNELQKIYQRQLQQGPNNQYNNNQYQQTNTYNNPYQQSQYNGQNTQYSNQFDASQYQTGSSQNGYSNAQPSSCQNCNQQYSQNNLQYNQPNYNTQSNPCQSCNQQSTQNNAQSSNQYQANQNGNNQASLCQSCNQQSSQTGYYNNQANTNSYGQQNGNRQYDPQYQSTQYGVAGSPYQNQGVYQNALGGSNNLPGNANGFVYDSPLTNPNSDFVVENPNYIFLNPALTQEFRDSVNRPNQNGLFRDQSGNVIPPTTTPVPILSNEQQNQLNYQRIQSNPPTTVSPSLYTNNLYGYDYRSNQNMPYTVNGNNQQYQPPAYRKFEAPSSSPFRKRRQAIQSLDGTAYAGQDRKFIRTDNFNQFNGANFQRNPPQNSYSSQTGTSYNNNNYNNNYNNNNNNQQYNYQTIQRDQQPNNAAIYWPYRQEVSADDVINPNSPNYTQVLQQNDAAEQAYENPNCSGQDPYWCQNYVDNFMLWQNQYNGQSQGPSQMSCGALAESLRSSYSRCCHSVRRVGCNA